MSDLNSPGAVAVGAVDPGLGTTIAPYSSERPANDNRIKPDLSASSCFETFTTVPAASTVRAGRPRWSPAPRR